MKRRDFFRFGLTGIVTMALSEKAFALQFYPKKSEQKWAVLYGTWCGSSRDAARMDF